MILTNTFHKPVLLPEVIQGLQISKDKRYIDATIGGGGYSFEVIRRKGIVLGLDIDQDALDHIKNTKIYKQLELREKRRLLLVKGNYKEVEKIAVSNNFHNIDGIIFDLGMSSYQIDKSKRGFSYKRDEPLDMRMDMGVNLTAMHLINNLPINELYEIFIKYAEELNSRPVAEAISRARTLKGEISTTLELSEIIDEAIGKNFNGNNILNKSDRQRIKARIFQALRIAVNNELENIKAGLSQGVNLLKSKGRMVVLSYHSLEDRIVKLYLKESEEIGLINIVTNKPLTAQWQEIKVNPRARAAKLRIAEKN